MFHCIFSIWLDEINQIKLNISFKIILFMFQHFFCTFFLIQDVSRNADPNPHRCQKLNNKFLVIFYSEKLQRICLAFTVFHEFVIQWKASGEFVLLWKASGEFVCFTVKSFREICVTMKRFWGNFFSWKAAGEFFYSEKLLRNLLYSV